MTINYGYTKVFYCETCNDNKKMTPKEAMMHLDSHNELREGTRELTLHISKKPRHISQYKWTFKNGTILTEVNS